MEKDTSDLEAFKARSQERKDENAPEGSKASQDYEARMIEAFVAKPEQPDKGLWYAMAFNKYNVNRIDTLAWKWSWWAFFGGMFFLLYRKAYAAAGGLFLITLISGIIPFGGFIVVILSGGFSTYFVYKVYVEKKSEIEAVELNEDKRVAMMQELGGYNQWVIWVSVILNVIVLIGVFSFISTLMSMIAASGQSY